MGVWIMAGITFREAARKKILWTALLAGVAFLLVFGIGLRFQVGDFRNSAAGRIRKQRRDSGGFVQREAIALGNRVRDRGNDGFLYVPAHVSDLPRTAKDESRGGTSHPRIPEVDDGAVSDSGSLCNMRWLAWVAAQSRRV